MIREQERLYHDPDDFRRLLENILPGRKFKLDCGHHFTCGTNLGNDFTIRDGKHLTIHL